MSFKIRKMTLEDIHQVLEIEHLSFQDPWTRESMEYEVSKNDKALYLVGVETESRTFGRPEANEKVVAYAGLWAIFDEGHITNIAVHPDHRGQKKGAILTSKIMEEANAIGVKHFTLEVKTTNMAAITMYEKLGFKTEGLRKNYYQYDNSDAYVMWNRQ